MNRLISNTIPTEAEPAPQRRLVLPEVATATETSADCLVFSPLHYEAKYAYPLLIWLHPEGSNQHHVKKIMPQISMRNYVAVAPQGTMSVPSAHPDGAGLEFTWAHSKDHIFLAHQRVTLALKQAAQFNIHPDRIFLAGSGCGGTMALRLAMLMPEIIRGVASLGGAFPTGRTPLARLPETRDLQVLLASSHDSGTYTPASVCRDLRLLHSAGIDVVMRQYPNRDALLHLSPPDVDRWIMETISADQQASVIGA